MKKIVLLLLIFGATSLLFITSCKKKSSDTVVPVDTSKNDTTPAPAAKFYFEAKINGVKVSFKDGVNGYGSGAGDQSGSSSEGYHAAQSALITRLFSTESLGGFYILKTFPGLTADEVSNSDIENMFKVQSYPFGAINPGSAGGRKNGAVVYYVDANGDTWSTESGSGNQTGSTFAITEHIANSDGFSNRITKATFSCKLYKSDGTSATLTEGVCRSRTVLLD